MTSIKVHCDDDCHNSPRKAHARDLVIAWADGDADAVTSALTDDATWQVVGRTDELGADAVPGYVAEIDKRGPSAIRIHNLLSHGKGVAVDGTLASAQGDLGFSHVITYASHSKNAKVAGVTSYVVPIRQ